VNARFVTFPVDILGGLSFNGVVVEIKKGTELTLGFAGVRGGCGCVYSSEPRASKFS